MARREVVGRYKGSAMGLLWSLINPLMMLVIYTFVFSVVFKAKWHAGDAAEPRSQFAILLFAGMIVQAFFAEVLNRSPQLIVANANYVKKVVFPLEVLVAVVTLAALFHTVISVGVLLLAYAVVHEGLQWTAVFLPLVFLPLAMLSMGCGWVISSLGVFARDIGQIVGVLTTVLMFLSPIFFPVSALPPSIQPWMQLNPLTFIIEQTRAVLIFGQLPDWSGLASYAFFASMAAWAGYAWFQKTRKGFADVL
ncbi:ABC transporter permease [Acidovorax sp. FG27]|uniref:ABC transporter permease n=1 Tax=Acidovorax sp. FG27 TaxID=3133652 RepID=UPI0033419139